MKVAVTAQGKTLSAPVAPHFARAPYFLLIDIGSTVFTVDDNGDLRRTLYLAGTQAAGAVVSQGTRAVVTMHIGPRAFATLRSAGIRVFQAQPGTVAEAIRSFASGRLMEISQANVGERWPQLSKT